MRSIWKGFSFVSSNFQQSFHNFDHFWKSVSLFGFQRKLIHFLLQRCSQNWFVKNRRTTVQSRALDFFQWNTIVFHCSVKNHLIALDRLYDFLPIVHRGASVCCYGVSSYPISFKYPETLSIFTHVKQTRLKSEKYGISHRTVLRLYNSVIVCAEIRSFMDKQSFI